MIPLISLSPKANLYSLINDYEKYLIDGKTLTLAALISRTEIMEHFRFLLIPATNTCCLLVYSWTIRFHPFFSLLWLFNFYCTLHIPLLWTHCGGLRRIKTMKNLICMWTSAVLSRAQSSSCEKKCFCLRNLLFVYFPLLHRRYQL